MTPFCLYRDKIGPGLDFKRSILEEMYSKRIGRPEIDPVLLMGITLLQIMERLPDRQALNACHFDARWRLALNLPSDWQGIDASSLSRFRERLNRHGKAQLILDVGLAAMREAGYLKARGAVRIDSTHLLGAISDMSRLECIRESLRLALDFLCAFGGEAEWEPWFSRYSERNPKELYKPSVQKILATMAQAGLDGQAVLLKAKTLGKSVLSSRPIQLLQRVWDEQFEAADTVMTRPTSIAGSVQNPHDPDAKWSMKKSLKKGWVGYKLQICETVVEGKRPKGEPTPAVITAVLAQPATTSDYVSITPVLDRHIQGGQEKPTTIHVDAGYISAIELARAEQAGLDICGPISSPPHGSKRFGTDAFDIDLPQRLAVCPAGLTNSNCSFIKEKYSSRSFYYFEWAPASCSTCALKQKCLSDRTQQGFRSLQVNEHYMLSQTRRRLCRTPEYQKLMRLRNAIEGSISELKRGYALRRVRYRGKERVHVQALFSAAACNLRRWSNRSVWLNRQNTQK